MTVLPYLIDHYYEEYGNGACYDEEANISQEPEYFTERELNGNAGL